MSSRLANALQHHQSGELQVAESLYRDILREEPQNPDALHLLGMLAHRLGRHQEAIERIGKAIAVSPNVAEYHNNLGSIHLDLGDYVAGEARCHEALRLDPNLAQARNNLGNALQGLGRFGEAILAYRQALRIDPYYVQAYANLGGLLRKLGRYEEAVSSCRTALALRPRFPPALHNLGDVLLALGNPQEAVPCFEQALVGDPDRPEILNSLGSALKGAGRLDEAIACFQHAVEIRPDSIQGQLNLATVLRLANRFEEAASCYRRAIPLAPQDATVRNNLGEVLWQRRQTDEARQCFEQAMGLAPGLATAHYNFANVLRDQGALEEGVASYRVAVALDPNFAPAWNNLALTLSEQGKCEEAFECFRRSLAIHPQDPRAHSHVLVCQQYLPGVSLEKLAEGHADWNDRHAVPERVRWRTHTNPLEPDRRLRVGFISRDFRRHPVGYFLTRVLESFDRSNFATVCYSDHQDPDDITNRLRAAATTWRVVRGASDRSLADQIRADAVDILVDLAGHTAAHRLLVLAQKPAPLQLTWMGYVGTTGLDAIDYLISDRFHTPGDTDSFYREQILRLPDGYICYDPPEDAPDVGPLPAASAGRVTFGSFNNPAKISTATIGVWSGILSQLPNSRLILKYAGFDDLGTERHFHSLFSQAGVAPERVELFGSSPHAELLECYNRIDIALDPLPYSGGLTTCEALWMGVPVITCPGSTFAGRHAFSHLANVGVTELVADSQNDYADRAVRLAQDLPRLHQLRRQLRQRVAISPLCDGPRFARGLEAAFRQIWRDWCVRSGQAASH